MLNIFIIFIFIFLMFSLLLIMSFISFSLWFIVIQSFLSLLVLLILIFYFSSSSVTLFSFITFLFEYLLLEATFELLILLNYVFNLECMFVIFLTFNVSSFPFLFYEKMISVFSFSYSLFSSLLVLYFFFSNLLVLVFIFVIPIPIESIFCYVFISLFYMVLSFNNCNPSFLSSSLILSNISFILLGTLFNVFLCFIYIILVSLVQYKSLGVMFSSKYGIVSEYSFLSLTLLNGNPIFIFNWFKFYIQSALFSISPCLTILYVFVNSLFLTNSIHMFMFNNKYNLLSFGISKFMNVFLFMSLTAIPCYYVVSNIVNDCFSLKSDYFYCVLFFNSYQFINLLPGVLSIDFFLLYGENLSVSISLIFFITYILFKGFDLGSLHGINGVSSILNNKYSINFFSFYVSFNYFDSLIFIIPYFLILISTSNFIFLVESISFLSFSDPMVLVFLLAYQWGWDVSICLSDNWTTYYNVFYLGHCHPTCSYYCLDFKAHMLFCFYYPFSDLLSSSSFLDFMFYDYFYSFIFISNSINVLCLPKSVCIFLQGISLDVIHALYLPSLCFKEDLVGENVLSVFLKVLSEDYLEFICFEYCGDFHHSMSGMFYVLESEVYFTSLFNNQ